MKKANSLYAVFIAIEIEKNPGTSSCVTFSAADNIEVRYPYARYVYCYELLRHTCRYPDRVRAVWYGLVKQHVTCAQRAYRRVRCCDRLVIYVKSEVVELRGAHVPDGYNAREVID